ncbi:MAG TPA: hypothetical protein VFQ79_24595 [Bryobacteraceae bacterium]|nr:hypothetical protein [Bryobacteraceae bacterium]
MTYTEQGDRVTLEMTRENFCQLLFLIVYATGAATREGDKTLFCHWIKFTNDLNATNPRWTPIEIPEEFRTMKDA